MRTQLYHPSSQTHETGSVELIDAWEKDPESILWLDFPNENPAVEKVLMKERFQLHSLAVQDATRDRHPPKFERFDNVLFIMLRGLTAETEDINFGDLTVAIFIGERCLLTRHSETSPSTDWLWNKVAKDPVHLRDGPQRLAIQLLGRVVKRYVPILQALEPRLEILEVEIFRNPKDEMIEELSIYKSRLTRLRRILTYHDQVVKQIRDDTESGISDDLRHELTDVHEHLERSLSLAQMYYELSSDLIDSYISLASHRLNHIMQVLTIVTVIFVPLTFLAGIYGMNFDYIPELKFRYSYFILLGVMLLVTTGLLAYFRKKKWL